MITSHSTAIHPCAVTQYASVAGRTLIPAMLDGLIDYPPDRIVIAQRNTEGLSIWTHTGCDQQDATRGCIRGRWPWSHWLVRVPIPHQRLRQVHLPLTVS